ncbi:GntR family transcriptional regulator [Paenibacillus chungangensis]|uniref:GntR family transcriptional regulator n=1 Tax=Paenibacillus chungangensis TaxID=696535 RepID=A0ABW3HLW2_9BACL
MLDDTLPVTLQYQLRMKLMEKIEGKIWSPGTQIPSERELCNEYGVSRMTVREVLKELVQDGYLVRKQGKGTFVTMREFKHELTSSYSLSEELEREGVNSDFKMISFDTCVAPEFLQEKLGLGGMDIVYMITRLRYIGDEPVSWERVYVPYGLMTGATIEQLDAEGLYATIYHCSGIVAEEAEVDVGAINCSAEIATILQIKKYSAVLHSLRWTLSGKRYIDFCEMYIVSDKYKYKYQQKLRQRATSKRGFFST